MGQATAGDMFGELGVLCQRPQPFTVRTTKLSQILRLKRTSLLYIIQSNTEDGNLIMNNFFMVTNFDHLSKLLKQNYIFLFVE